MHDGQFDWGGRLQKFIEGVHKVVTTTNDEFCSFEHNGI